MAKKKKAKAQAKKSAKRIAKKSSKKTGKKVSKKAGRVSTKKPTKKKKTGKPADSQSSAKSSSTNNTRPTATVDWFEIPVADMPRARSFYESVFQFTMKPVGAGPLNMMWFPEGAYGCLMQAESYVPSHSGTLIYLYVRDITATLNRVPAAGGRILNPKFSIGEFGFVGHFEDSEGNRVALHSDS